MQERAEHNFTTGEVATITGTTLRQLQWWSERGALEPDVIRHKRYWAPDDVIAASVVSDLMRRGMRLIHVKSALRRIESRSGRYAAVEYLIGSKGSPRIAVGDSLEDVIFLSDGWDRPVIIIDRDIRGKIRNRARKATM